MARSGWRDCIGPGLHRLGGTPEMPVGVADHAHRAGPGQRVDAGADLARLPPAGEVRTGDVVDAAIDRDMVGTADVDAGLGESGTKMQALVDGKINFIVECNPLLGDKAADLVKKVLDGEEVDKAYYVEDQSFTPEQAAEVIDSRPY